MKEITTCEIGKVIAEAIEQKKSNVLFVSKTLDYKNAISWFDANKNYRIFRFATPQPIYEEKNGILVKNTECFVIDDQKIKKLNITLKNGFLDFSLKKG